MRLLGQEDYRVAETCECMQILRIVMVESQLYWGIKQRKHEGDGKTKNED
jgi:hypothetical protein